MPRYLEIKFMNWKTLFCKQFLFWLVLFLASIPNDSLAQNPTFYKIGEAELETEDVYSMCSTSDNALYIGVENGMMKYENESFKYLSFQKEFNNHSLFHVIRNSHDEVFCLDLKGRVFQAVQDSLILIFKLENEFLNTLPQLICGPDDNLYLSTKKIYKISTKGVLLQVLDIESKLHPLKDRSFFYFDNNGVVHVTKNGAFHYDSKIYHVHDVNYTKLVYKLKQWLFESDRSHINKIPDVEHLRVEKTVENYQYCYQVDTSRFFILNHIQGVSEIEIDRDRVLLDNRIFKDHFISSYCSSDNGIHYFGTFKQGIIVAPNIQFKSVTSNFIPKSILDFSINAKDEIYVSLRNKGIYKITDKSPKLIEKSTRYTFSKLIYADSLNYENEFHGKDQMFYKTNRTGALKDLAVINKDNGIMLCNSGLNLLAKEDTFLNQKWLKKKNFYFYDKLRGRNLAVEFDQKSQKLFVANQYDLYLIERGKDPYGIKWKNKQISASDILFKNDTLWISDFNKGILSLINGQVALEFNTENGLFSNLVTQISKFKNRLYVIAAGKLQIIDLDSRSVIPVSNNLGVIGRVNKIQIQNENLWILADNSNILSIPIDKLPSNILPIQLQIKSIRNNEEELADFSYRKFNKTENKFLFNFDLSNFSTNEETKLCYKLNGLDEQYHCVPFSNEGVEYKSLPPGNYVFKAYCQYGSMNSNEIAYTFRVKQSFWLSTRFILSFIAGALTFIYYFLKIRMRVQDQRAEQKYREHQTNLELMESKLVALRSQMNPHFIFNSLNAIQDLILKKNTLFAYDYIVLFSQLTRSTLQFSTKEFISLGKEIEFLTIYLKLEKLRFSDDFTYSIEANGVDNFQVPTLIIQPFIENALKHGLRHKSGNKELVVKFTEEKDNLRCIIRDNGIGQEEALKIKKRQGKSQKSFAIESIQDRLRILSKKHNQIYSFEMIDLKHNGKSCGTEVRLYIPKKINSNFEILDN